MRLRILSLREAGALRVGGSSASFLFAPLVSTLRSRPRSYRPGQSCGDAAPRPLVRSHDRAASPSKGTCLLSFDDMADAAANPKNLPVEFTFDGSLVRTVVKDGEAGSSPRTSATFSISSTPVWPSVGLMMMREVPLVHRFQSSNHIKRLGRAYRTKYGRRGVG